jgi:hypothetical protein
MNTIEELRTKYTLTEEQVGFLATETTLALLGIIPITEYESGILKKFTQTKEVADSIIKELRDKIFTPITSDLARTHEENITLGKRANPLNIHPLLTTLPEELQEAIKKSDYQKNLYTISTRHKLPIDKMSFLEETTVAFMAGNMSPSDYEQKLIDGLGVNRDETKTIVDEVNKEVLLVIRNFMKGEDGSNQIQSDDIPRQPYRPKELTQKGSQMIRTTTTLPKTQSGILATAGIEMMEEKEIKGSTETEVTSKEGGILSKSGITMIDDTPRAPQSHILPSDTTRRNTLEGVEHPTKTTRNIVL